MAPGGFASIALARQLFADRIDRACQNNWKTIKQVRFANPVESTPSTSQSPQDLAASPPHVYSPTTPKGLSASVLNTSQAPPDFGTSPLQVYSPTSALAPAETVLKASGLTTEQFDRMLDTSVSAPAQGTVKTSRVSPSKQFERMLDNELKERKRAEKERVTKSWWW